MLYDIIDDIAEKQVMKTDTGDNRIFGVVVGIVAKNYDKDMPGRLCVTVPTRDQRANELKWARVAMLYGGSSWGIYFLPEVGDKVLLVFEQGNIEKPYVIGCIPKDSDQILKSNTDQNNQFKRIRTKNGNMIYLEDNKEGNGEKDKIRILTARGDHKLELDNSRKMICLSDKDGKNTISMNTEKGQMEITAEKKLTIRVGDKIRVTMNGSNGDIQVKADKINVETGGSTRIKANGALKTEGSNVSVKANASLKLESSGAVIASGKPVKLG